MTWNEVAINAGISLSYREHNETLWHFDIYYYYHHAIWRRTTLKISLPGANWWWLGLFTVPGEQRNVCGTVSVIIIDSALQFVALQKFRGSWLLASRIGEFSVDYDLLIILMAFLGFEVLIVAVLLW